MQFVIWSTMPCAAELVLKLVQSRPDHSSECLVSHFNAYGMVPCSDSCTAQEHTMTSSSRYCHQALRIYSTTRDSLERSCSSPGPQPRYSRCQDDSRSKEMQPHNMIQQAVSFPEHSSQRSVPPTGKVYNLRHVYINIPRGGHPNICCRHSHGRRSNFQPTMCLTLSPHQN